MSAKSILGVIIVAILIGVVYVVFEKNFTGSETLSNSKPSSAQEVAKDTAAAQEESSLINYPAADSTPASITGSTDLLQEAEGLQMRDYSTYFEELKETVSK